MKNVISVQIVCRALEYVLLPVQYGELLCDRQHVILPFKGKTESKYSTVLSSSEAVLNSNILIKIGLLASSEISQNSFLDTNSSTFEFLNLFDNFMIHRSVLKDRFSLTYMQITHFNVYLILLRDVDFGSLVYQTNLNIS